MNAHMNDDELGSAIRRITVSELRHLDDLAAAVRSVEHRLRSEGYRIVTHKDHHDDEDVFNWTIRDVQTGETLASGAGHEAMDAAWQDDWWHVDAAGDEAYASVTDSDDVPDGVPDGLYIAVRDWVCEHTDEARRCINVEPNESR